MSMNVAIIGVGSNIQPEKNIAQAINLLEERVHILKKSRFVQTQPIGCRQQDDFMNGCLLVETDKERELFTAELKLIEKTLGRVKQTDRYGPRTIDLDLLTWNGQIKDTDVYHRDFIQKGILELVPDFRF